MGKLNRILSAAILLLCAHVADAAAPPELATQVKAILKTSCYRCHGERGAAEGGMAYVTDLAKLVERKKVVPGNPAGSKLYKKMASEDDPMPPLTDDDNKPITQRPSKPEIALVRQWIEAGAPDDAPAIALGVPKDQAQAVAWYTRAADAGSAFAMLQLGACYENGQGIAKDADQAAALYAKALRTASVNAETDGLSATCLALIYDQGKGVNRDVAQKYNFYRKAAERGEPFALTYLATVSGFDVGQHEERGLEAFQTAADAGNLDAMRMLGLLMGQLNGADGRARLEKVAAAGVADAMMDLVTIYSEGRGVAKDDAQLSLWMGRAAVAGHYDAMIQLANRCEAAFVANKDQNAHDLAVAWMRQAATREPAESPGPARKWLTDRGLVP